MGTLSRGGATNLDSFHDDIISEIINLIYPVGSIYMSVNSTNPGELFGGTWKQIQGRFLLGQGSGYSAGEIGGEANHTLTVAEMPSHYHAYATYQNGYPSSYTGDKNYITPVGRIPYSPDVYSGTETSSTGSNISHNNMPPYLVVYIWKRIA